jgi:hypothetical protein
MLMSKEIEMRSRREVDISIRHLKWWSTAGAYLGDPCGAGDGLVITGRVIAGPGPDGAYRFEALMPEAPQ